MFGQLYTRKMLYQSKMSKGDQLNMLFGIGAILINKKTASSILTVQTLRMRHSVCFQNSK